jgi:CBS domain-containing protein
MSDATARDIMTVELVTVSPDTSVTDASRLMVEHRVGSLPVLDGDKVVGIVTESDLIHQDAKVHFPTYLDLLGGYVFSPGSTERFEQSLRKAVGASVADVMTPKPITVTPDAAVEDISTLLVERDVGSVLVLDGDKLVGVVSKSDIVRHLASGA